MRAARLLSPGHLPRLYPARAPHISETTAASDQMPSATPEALAAAIIETIEAGARVLNLSVALAQPSTRGEHALEEALDYAVSRGAIPVAAAGNQGRSAVRSSPAIRGSCRGGL